MVALGPAKWAIRAFRVILSTSLIGLCIWSGGPLVSSATSVGHLQFSAVRGGQPDDLPANATVAIELRCAAPLSGGQSRSTAPASGEYLETVHRNEHDL
jgi:hypothetical protein